MNKPSSTKIKFSKKCLAQSILLSSVLVFTGCGEPSSSDANVSNHIKRGTSYMNQGQYKAALIESKNALQKAPKSTDAIALMAQILNSLGQSKNALKLMTDISDSEASAEFLFTKADTLLKLQKSTSALKLIQNNKDALQQADSKRSNLLEAQSLMTLARVEQAQKIFEDIISSDPKNIEARLGLAKIHLQDNKTEKAETLLADIFTIDANSFDALLVYARLQHVQGDLAGAEDSLSNALAALPNTDIMTPERIITLRSLSEVLTQQGRSAEALLYSKILAEAQPGMDELQQDYGQAITLLKEGKIDEAEALLVKVLEKAPYHEGASQLLGIINYSQGDIESASQHFAGNIDPETAPEQAKTVYAMTNLRLNKPDAVLKLLGDGIESNKNPKTLSLYGMAALAAGQYSTGEKTLKKVLELNPNASRIRLVLARHYNTNQPQRPELGLELLTTAYQQTPKDPYIQSALIQQYMGLDKKDKAHQIAEDIAKNNPDSESSQVIAGNYYLINLQFQSAKKLFIKALALSPKSINALQGLGKSNLALKQYDQALQNFKDLINLNPQHPLGYKGLVSTHEIKGQAEEGIKRLEDIAKNSKYATPAAILAEYYGRKNNFEIANRFLNDAKSIEPDNIEVKKLAATLSLAEAAKTVMTDIDQARVVTMKGLADSPNDQRLLSMLTSIEIKAENYREASKLITQIEDDNQQLSNLLRGNLAEAQKDTQLAIKHYRTAWEAAPNDLIASKLYTQLKLTGDSAPSRAFLSEWLSLFPNSLDALTTNSNVEILAGRYNNAIRHLERALSRQRDKSPALLNNLAWAYLQIGDFDQAKTNGKAAYEAAPKSPAIIDTYGWILVKSNKIKEGVAILEQAIALAPDNSEIKKHLTEARSQL